MTFFDASARFGKEITNHEVVNHEDFIILEPVDAANDAAALAGRMDEAGIAKAIVSHSSMYEFDPVRGNKQLIDEIANFRGRLVPSWIILPEITDRVFKCEPFFDAMKANGVKTLRAYPHINRYLLNSVTMGRQLKYISEYKIPLYLEARFGYEYIYAVLAEFPELTVVVSNTGCWPSARYIYPLFEQYKNVRLETGDLTMLRGHEEIAARFGIERLLFATNFPTNNMGCAISALTGSLLTTNQKETVSSGNLEFLLGEARL